MNIFIIPSWYPSDINSVWGIFCKEQAEAMAYTFPQANVGIGLWGHTKKQNLIYFHQPFKSLIKLIRFGLTPRTTKKTSINNFTEFYTPTLTWSRKIKRGNIKKILEANEINLLEYEKKFGKPNVIHAHVGFPAGYIAMHLSQKFSIPYVITEHMVPMPFVSFKNKDGTLIDELEKSYKKASRIIAVSQQLKLSIVDLGFDKVVVIPNWVNESLFQIKKGVPRENAFKFLFIGDIGERKGIDILLKAISKVHVNKKIELKIGGEGSCEKRYKILAKKLGIDEIVHWAGFVSRDNVAREMQRCDVVVLPSKKENLPVVLIEAIACGKPVIATNCGGPEMIVNDDNGILVEVDDTEGLANSMEFMLDNYSKYDPAVIRMDFANRFSRPVVTKQIMEVYQNVIDEFYQKDCS